MPAKQAEGQRIDLDGGYVVMRPMNIDDLLAFAEADTNVGPAIRSVKGGCLESKFKNGKPLGEQSIDVLTAILRGWNRAEDEVALPPASAPPSASPSTGR
jgi:hypothetical protein